MGDIRRSTILVLKSTDDHQQWNYMHLTQEIAGARERGRLQNKNTQTEGTASAKMHCPYHKTTLQLLLAGLHPTTLVI
jgi:hypothetical protein